MEDNIKIRKLIKEDYNDVFELEKQVHKIHYSNRPDLYNDVSNLFPKDYYESILESQNSILRGIDIEGKIVGIILSEIKETSNISIVKKRKYCYIDDIVVKSVFFKRST